LATVFALSSALAMAQGAGGGAGGAGRRCWRRSQLSHALEGTGNGRYVQERHERHRRNSQFDGNKERAPEVRRLIKQKLRNLAGLFIHRFSASACDRSRRAPYHGSSPAAFRRAHEAKAPQSSAAMISASTAARQWGKTTPPRIGSARDINLVRDSCFYVLSVS
jgi:hypothetical protein